MTSWWNEQTGNGATPQEFLYANWNELTDQEIANALSKMTGRKVSRKSIERKRAFLGLSKKQWTHDEEKEGYHFRDTGPNTAEASAKTERITSLDQLLKACKVDLNIWRVDHHILNIWEVGAKEKRGHLQWTDGIVDGEMEYDGLHTHSLYQVKAWLVQIDPEPVFPVIRPITCTPINTESSSRPTRDGIHRALIIADPHIGFRKDLDNALLTPFHDRRVLDIALQIAKSADEFYAMELIAWIGDLVDMTEWTDRFTREPEFAYTTQPSLCEAHWWLRQFKEIPGVEVEAFEGNHEKRMRAAILNHLPAAYGLSRVGMQKGQQVLTIQYLLALDSLGVKWSGDYPNDLEWLNDELALCHGDVARGAPGATARAMIDKKRCGTIYGHTHTTEMLVKCFQAREGSINAVGFCPGCACHIDGRVPGSSPDRNWQQGIAIVDYDDGASYTITPIPINDGTAIWDGKLWTGHDRSDEIREAFPDYRW